MDLVVRPMRPEDLAAVERIYKAHAKPAEGGGRRRRPMRARIEEALAAPPESPAIALVGADDKDRVRGYLVGEVRSWEFGSAPAGWIFAVGVDPRVERQGLGRRLLDEAVARFRALGVTTVRTMVQKDDVPVLRFFRSGRFTAGPYVELELGLD